MSRLNLREKGFLILNIHFFDNKNTCVLFACAFWTNLIVPNEINKIHLSFLSVSNSLFFRRLLCFVSKCKQQQLEPLKYALSKNLLEMMAFYCCIWNNLQKNILEKYSRLSSSLCTIPFFFIRLEMSNNATKSFWSLFWMQTTEKTSNIYLEFYRFRMKWCLKETIILCAINIYDDECFVNKQMFSSSQMFLFSFFVRKIDWKPIFTDCWGHFQGLSRIWSR